MVNGTIYIIKNSVNNKVYIGKTIRSVKARYREHTNRDLHDNLPIHRAMLKYGVENFWYEILDIDSIEKLNNLEKYWIKYYNSTESEYGYNLNPGGNGGICYHNIGNYWKNQNREDFIRHQKDANKRSLSYFKEHPEEFKLAQNKRLIASQEWRKNNPEKAHCIQEKATKIAAEKNSIPIEKYDLNTGEVIEQFKNAKEASQITGIDPSSIRKCCNSRLKGCIDKRNGVKYGWRNIK